MRHNKGPTIQRDQKQASPFGSLKCDYNPLVQSEDICIKTYSLPVDLSKMTFEIREHENGNLQKDPPIVLPKLRRRLPSRRKIHPNSGKIGPDVESQKRPNGEGHSS